MSSPIDVGALVSIGEAIALDLIAWIRQHQAEFGTLPTNEEVVARAKGKVAAIQAEAAAALEEFPDTGPA